MIDRRTLRFGQFEVDGVSGELRRQGVLIRLQDQPGEVVTRDELRSQIWSEDTFVDFDQSLSKAIGKLRYALGDDAANPRFIETLPKRGYRFLAPVHAVGSDVSPHPPHRERPFGRTLTAVVVAAALCIGGGQRGVSPGNRPASFRSGN